MLHLHYYIFDSNKYEEDSYYTVDPLDLQIPVMQFRWELYKEMVENKKFSIRNKVLGKRSANFSVITPSQKAVKLLDTPEKLIDYFEKQVGAKKVDRRNRLEVRFAIGTCNSSDEIDAKYITTCPSSVWDETDVFDMPRLLLSNEEQSNESKDHTDHVEKAIKT